MTDLCREYQESYGVSPLSEEASRHAEGCPNCQAFRVQQDHLQTVLAGWSTPPFSGDFALSVMSRIAEDEAQEPGFWEQMRSLFSRRLLIPVPVGALGMLLLLGSMTLNLVHWMGSPSGALSAGPQIVLQPAGLPTPLENGPSTGAYASYPSRWTGSGAFLLIPMVDPHGPLMAERETGPEAEIKTEGI